MTEREKKLQERIKELEDKTQECHHCGKGNYDCLTDMEMGKGICCDECNHQSKH